LTNNTRTKKALKRHALRTESAARLMAMIRLASSERSIMVKPDAFDVDPMLLNTLNCVIDLRDGTPYEHDKARRLMKQIGTEYDPDAQCPAWKAYLEKIMDGNTNLILFLQKALGYSLTGLTNEQVVFFLHGSGSNGKSTFLETIRYILGDYSKNTPTSTIMRRGDSSGVNNDVARLPGVRLVTAVETDEGQQLSEATIKSITGGDTIVARFLFGEFFEFKPTFKLWLACNHLPTITGTDNGIWRRIRRIPFTVKIREDEKDPQLPAKLQAEAPGILNWMINGCLLWQEDGLGIPDEIAEANKEYQSEMDTLAAFIQECCVTTSSNLKAPATDLYKAYQQWSDSSGEKTLSQTAFGKKLAERGFAKGRNSFGRVIWEGIGVRPSEGSE
jgi:putative DNA primase/helicase